MVKGAVYDGASGGPSGSSPSTILLTCTRTHSSGNDLGHCAICPSSSHYSARSLSEAEDTGMRSVGLFPRGSVPGLKHQWNCDLLPLLHACTSFCFQSLLSKHFSVSTLSLSSPFPFHTLWVIFAFIPPNNIMHHPIRAGKPFISCPRRFKRERWETERKKGKWEDRGGQKRAEGQRGNSEWDDTDISWRAVCAGEGGEKAHLGRNSIDSLCNIAAIKTPMLGVRRTKTNVSLSRAGSDSTVLTTAPAHIRFWSSIMRAGSQERTRQLYFTTAALRVHCGQRIGHVVWKHWCHHSPITIYTGDQGTRLLK